MLYIDPDTCIDCVACVSMNARSTAILPRRKTCPPNGLRSSRKTPSTTRARARRRSSPVRAGARARARASACSMRAMRPSFAAELHRPRVARARQPCEPSCPGALRRPGLARRSRWQASAATASIGSDRLDERTPATIGFSRSTRAQGASAGVGYRLRLGAQSRENHRPRRSAPSHPATPVRGAPGSRCAAASDGSGNRRMPSASASRARADPDARTA